MRKTLALLMAIALLFVLCACGSDKGEDEGKQDVAVNLPDNGKKAPSEEMITEDIRNELMTKNQYASLVGVETVKSLTNEGSYELTASITAETKYADWTYEADLSYTKYDQGWMLDGVDWLRADYTQARMPDADTMIEYATRYLTQHEVYSDVSYSDYMVPMYDPVMDSYFDSSANANVIRLSWDARDYLKHAEQIHDCVTLWIYEPDIDNWVLMPDDEHGSLGYCVDWNWGGTVVPDTSLDFSGEWYADSSSHVYVFDLFTSIVISDFSWESFTAEIPGFDQRVSRGWDSTFVRVDSDQVVFENGYGDQISFAFGDDWTEISMTCKGDTIAAAEGRISIDLPQLP